jgi:hypothetical protein
MRGRFGLLVAAQTAHSIEEYVGRLWESFPPARALAGLVSTDRELGFLAINVGLVAFGVWGWAVPMRRGYASARTIAWFWVVLEAVNGLVHPLWSLSAGGYTPGAATAPLLLAFAALLGAEMCRQPATSSM